MLFTIIFGVLCCLILLFYWLKNINADYWKKQNIVYVKKTNPFGISLDFVLNNKALPIILKEIIEKYPNEDHIGIFQGWKAVLLMKDPEDIQAVMTGDFNSFHNRGIVTNPKDILADNILFMNDYQKWKLTRQKFSPLFTSAKLKNMFYIIEHCAKDFVEYVAEKENDITKPFEIINIYTTASIAASVFGIDTNMKSSMDSPFVKMSLSASAAGIFRKFQSLIGDFWPELVNVLNIKFFGAQEDFFISAVKDVLRKREKENIKRHDFIDICLELQRNGTMVDPLTNYKIEPSDEFLAAQAFFFFIAGADTTASTIHFTLFELSMNPDILKRLHEEIDQIFLKYGDKLPFEEVYNMQYLDMVINESMRKYPAIGFLQRLCTKDTVLPRRNIQMKKNTVAIIPVFALHRDPKYFPNPDKFDPERFSAENIDKIEKYSYFPFGEGNRVCLGSRLARIQIKTCFAYLLRRYTLKPIDNEANFEESAFAIRDADLRYEFVKRK